MRTHGRTDMTTVILAIRYYANAPKNNALHENQFCPSVRLSVTWYYPMIISRMSMKFGLVAVVEICRSVMSYGYLGWPKAMRYVRS
jgi:hypothetical protein